MDFIKKVPSGVAVALCLSLSLSVTAIAVLWINGTYAAREKNRWQVAAAEFARAKERADGPVQEERNAAIPIKGHISVRGIDPDYGCNPPAEDRASDLCAQWKAADAAETSAVVAGWTLIVSVLTFAAVIYGFWRDAQARQLEYRAYIRSKAKIKGLRINGQMWFDITLVNYGRTPAKKIKTVTQVHIAHSGAQPWHGLPDVGMPVVGAVEAQLHNGDDLNVRIDIPLALTVANLRDVQLGRTRICARFHVHYQDVFGKTHIHRCSIELGTTGSHYFVKLASTGNEDS